MFFYPEETNYILDTRITRNKGNKWLYWLTFRGHNDDDINDTIYALMTTVFDGLETSNF